MALDPDHERELRVIQDQAVANAIEEMTAAGQLTIATQEDRGDRFWLTKMATQSMTIAAKIEGYIMLRSRPASSEPPDPEAEDRAVDRMIKQARGEVAAVLERARQGSRRRGQADE
jgi:hypothetical protein